MSTRDGNDQRYRIAFRLEDWARLWELTPSWLTCRACGQMQTFQSAAKAFPGHKPGCLTPADFAQYPMRELAEVLRLLPADPEE